MARRLLLAVDPAAGLRFPRPHAGQQRVIAQARRFNVLAAGRRWGKNTLAEGRIILPALLGRPVAWFSPIAWQQVIRPMLTDYSGDAWFISTPVGLNDFYTVYQARRRAIRTVAPLPFCNILGRNAPALCFPFRLTPAPRGSLPSRFQRVGRTAVRESGPQTPAHPT
jgi:hypothetical protein